MMTQASGVHNAHRLTLKGESLEAGAKRQKLTATPSTGLM
jgi:hypothetical protein